jgi:hypothetical protein
MEARSLLIGSVSVYVALGSGFEKPQSTLSHPILHHSWRRAMQRKHCKYKALRDLREVLFCFRNPSLYPLSYGD